MKRKTRLIVLCCVLVLDVGAAVGVSLYEEQRENIAESGEVVFELPDAVEAAGYSRATKARLDGSKIRALGWKPMYNIKTGMERTVKILRSINGEGN